MTQKGLVNKTCIPCRSNVPSLSREVVSTLLAELRNNWIVNNLGHLYKEYRFSNFMSAMVFANQIAELAEQEKHHPHLTITWGICTVEIWTHKIDGLTENDFILAAKTDLI